MSSNNCGNEFEAYYECANTGAIAGASCVVDQQLTKFTNCIHEMVNRSKEDVGVEEAYIPWHRLPIWSVRQRRRRARAARATATATRATETAQAQAQAVRQMNETRKRSLVLQSQKVEEANRARNLALEKEFADFEAAMREGGKKSRKAKTRKSKK